MYNDLMRSEQDGADMFLIEIHRADPDDNLSARLSRAERSSSGSANTTRTLPFVHSYTTTCSVHSTTRCCHSTVRHHLFCALDDSLLPLDLSLDLFSERGTNFFEQTAFHMYDAPQTSTERCGAQKILPTTTLSLGFLIIRTEGIILPKFLVRPRSTGEK